MVSVCRIRMTTRRLFFGFGFGFAVLRWSVARSGGGGAASKVSLFAIYEYRRSTRYGTTHMDVYEVHFYVRPPPQRTSTS